MPNILSVALKQHITNALGKKSNRKTVIIESDDWGTIRMPSAKTYNILTQKGLNVDNPYNRYDSLATEEDLSILFELIVSFKDYKGNHPALTANCLVANPDFTRIKNSNFGYYYSEPFTETFKKYPGCKNSFDLWKEGMEKGLFHPQFHGREHLNVPSWLTALKKKDKDTLLGFEHGYWGHKIQDKDSRRSHYLAAYDFNNQEESDCVCMAATEGVKMFEKYFGYQSKSFIAPNFVWSPDIEKAMQSCGVIYVQSQRNQLIPNIQAPGFKTQFHYTGQKNSFGQKYLVRNAYFEPALDPSIDWVSSCLKDISRAFLWKTPAIISAHRVNFIGAIVEENRTRNLVSFRKLLAEILKRWPEVEFLTTDQLFSH